MADPGPRRHLRCGARPAGGAFLTRARVGRHRRDWEELASLDAMWAVLSDPGLRGGGWQERVDEFYASGRAECDGLRDRLGDAGIDPPTGSALDFGCGLGRITTALAERYDRVVGVDHSHEMVARARQAAGTRGIAVGFVVADSPAALAERFDLVWCGLVIQHQPSREAAWRLVDALAQRVGAGGVLALQVPVVLGWRRRIQPRRRLYGLGRRLGVGHDVLFHRLGLNPIRMLALDEAELTRRLAARGLRVVDLERRVVGADQVDALLLAHRPA